MNFIEISSELGGSSLALSSLGARLHCRIDWRKLANSFSQLAFRECDIVVTQPPSGGSTGGFMDESGEWFGLKAAACRIMSVMEVTKARRMLMIARESAAFDRKGASIAEFIFDLDKVGFDVAWVKVNLSDFDLPQNSARFALLARSRGQRFRKTLLEELAGPLGVEARLSSASRLQDIVADREPRPGRPAPTSASPLLQVGYASEGLFRCGTVSRKASTRSEVNLGDRLRLMTVDGRSLNAESVRLVSRNGIRGLQVTGGGLAHSMGPGVSAWPLILVKDGHTPSPKCVNWERKVGDSCIYRLSPDVALGLFGEEALSLSSRLTGHNLAEQYQLASSTIPPRVVSMLFNSILE